MKLAQPSQGIVGLGKNVRKKNYARSKIKQEDKLSKKKNISVTFANKKQRKQNKKLAKTTN